MAYDLEAAEAAAADFERHCADSGMTCVRQPLTDRVLYEVGPRVMPPGRKPMMVLIVVPGSRWAGGNAATDTCRHHSGCESFRWIQVRAWA